MKLSVHRGFSVRGVPAFPRDCSSQRTTGTESAYREKRLSGNSIQQSYPSDEGKEQITPKGNTGKQTERACLRRSTKVNLDS